METTLERPVLAVDVALLSLIDGTLHVLLHRRDEAPFQGQLCLPGVAVRVQETLADAAGRALSSKACIAPAALDDIHLEQLATFDGLFRDPRGRTVGVAYLGLARTHTAESEPIRWRPVAELGPGSLPFDHGGIVSTAVERLRGKLRYTSIAAHLMPARFRADELRTLYEAILGRALNRSNFRTKLLRIGLLEQVGGVVQRPGARNGHPAHLYRFTSAEAGLRDFL